MVNRRLGCSPVNCFYVIQSLLKWIHNVHVLSWNVDIVDLTISECTSIQPNHFSLGEPTIIFICICSIFFLLPCFMWYYSMHDYAILLFVHMGVYFSDVYVILGLLVISSLCTKILFVRAFNPCLIISNFILYHSSAAICGVLSSFLCCYSRWQWGSKTHKPERLKLRCPCYSASPSIYLLVVYLFLLTNARAPPAKKKLLAVAVAVFVPAVVVGDQKILHSSKILHGRRDQQGREERDDHGHRGGTSGHDRSLQEDLSWETKIDPIRLFCI
jgi:hypothetical protein